jgi:hypothetical protein
LRRLIRRAIVAARRRFRQFLGRPHGAVGAPVFCLVHACKRYERRADELTVNVSGYWGDNTRSALYRLNGGDWRPVGRGSPRVPAHLFLVELPLAGLRPGDNLVEFEIQPKKGAPRRVEHRFEYGDTVPVPCGHDWRSSELDVSDGLWEKFEQRGETWARPRPGEENYDRLLVVGGAFPVPRRVTVDLVYRCPAGPAGMFGFGVLPLWGGHPDLPDTRPRRGWRFSLLWYYSHYKGVGMEFSERFGDRKPAWTSCYRNFDLNPGQRYRLIAEVWTEESMGQHTCFRQRARWFNPDSEEYAPWMELADVYGAPLPRGDYAVAVVAHRCQVEFGPVKIERLDAATQEPGARLPAVHSTR